MASIVTRTRKDGKRSYHVKYRAGDGRIHWEHVHGDKRAAKARARDVEDQLHRSGGRWTPPVPEKCGTAADEWLERVARPKVSPRVFENYERTFRLVLKPAVGDVELGALTPEHMDAIVAKLRKDGEADNTIRNQMIPIRSMLNDALRRRRITTNPALALEISGGKRRKIVPPTRDQIAQLTEHVREEARDALVVATVTGLRRGELFALRWVDVDFAARTISVHASNHAGRITETTKTEAGERFVPLFESA